MSSLSIPTSKAKTRKQWPRRNRKSWWPSRTPITRSTGTEPCWHFCGTKTRKLPIESSTQSWRSSKTKACQFSSTSTSASLERTSTWSSIPRKRAFSLWKISSTNSHFVTKWPDPATPSGHSITTVSKIVNLRFISIKCYRSSAKSTFLSIIIRGMCDAFSRTWSRWSTSSRIGKKTRLKYLVRFSSTIGRTCSSHDSSTTKTSNVGSKLNFKLICTCWKKSTIISKPSRLRLLGSMQTPFAKYLSMKWT